MNKRAEGYKLNRNMQLCYGTRSCGLCVEDFPPLSDGSMEMAPWAVDENSLKLHETMQACRAEALELIRI